MDSKRKRILRDSFEVINREVEIAAGLSSSDAGTALAVAFVVYLLLQKLNYAIVAGGIVLVLIAQLKKELGSTKRVVSLFEYFVRPKRYGRKRC